MYSPSDPRTVNSGVDGAILPRKGKRAGAGRGREGRVRGHGWRPNPASPRLPKLRRPPAGASGAAGVGAEPLPARGRARAAAASTPARFPRRADGPRPRPPGRPPCPRRRGGARTSAGRGPAAADVGSRTRRSWRLPAAPSARLGSLRSLPRPPARSLGPATGSLSPPAPDARPPASAARTAAAAGAPTGAPTHARSLGSPGPAAVGGGAGTASLRSLPLPSPPAARERRTSASEGPPGRLARRRWSPSRGSAWPTRSTARTSPSAATSPRPRETPPRRRRRSDPGCWPSSFLSFAALQFSRLFKVSGWACEVTDLMLFPFSCEFSLNSFLMLDALVKNNSVNHPASE